jgi:CO/xanthine dehydrogenase Mo-binding subunit
LPLYRRAVDGFDSLFGPSSRTVRANCDRLEREVAGRTARVMGTMAEGQDHETSSAQLVTEWLGVRFDSIDYVVHDTARVAAGWPRLSTSRYPAIYG